MKKITIIAAVAVMALASCSKSNNEGEAVATNGAAAIEFRGVVEKTKASLVGDITSFFVLADKGEEDFSFLKAAVYKEGTAWTYSPKKYYPTDDSEVNFYAYAPIKDANMSADPDFNSSDVKFGYTVPNDYTDYTTPNKATDLLVSSSFGHTSTNASVAFQFEHALSAATFSARNLNATGSELVYVIHKIEITELDNEGEFTYDPDYDGTPSTVVGAWDIASPVSNVTYTAGLPASGIAVSPAGAAASYVKLLTANDVMMVLPQEPVLLGTISSGVPSSDGTFVIVTFSLKSGDGQYIYQNEERKLALNSGFEFEMGKQYNFRFDFDASDAVTLSVAGVTSWGTDVDSDI